MNTTSTILLLPERSIFSSPPKDRAVWLQANLVAHHGAMTDVEGFEGYARWDENLEGWVDVGGRPIFRAHNEEVHPLGWMELAERAKDAPERETDLTANVYFWDTEFRRERGKAGYFALCQLDHSPTRVRLYDRCLGPYVTQAEALGVLCGLIAEVANLRMAGAQLQPVAA